MAAAAGSIFNVDADTNVAAQGQFISAVNISSQEGAQDAIDIIDKAIGKIDEERGNLGALQNRFESTIANLQNISENISAARSRILDADIAQETSNMTKQNILAQAGISILAQANQSPQLALSLLG
ncbi:flagellin [Desulfobulbus alkaliphilus]|uniref:flagellin n=1 Tax=Desulfobulbus alkaliphilus TaxID=869814 RepID=UPI0035319CF9